MCDNISNLSRYYCGLVNTLNVRWQQCAWINRDHASFVTSVWHKKWRFWTEQASVTSNEIFRGDIPLENKQGICISFFDIYNKQFDDRDISVGESVRPMLILLTEPL